MFTAYTLLGNLKMYHNVPLKFPRQIATIIPGVDPLLEAQASDAAPHGRLVNRSGVTRHGHLYRPEVPHHGSEVEKTFLAFKILRV